VNLYVFGWDLPEGLAVRVQEELLHIVEAYPQLAASTLWSFSGDRGVFASSIHSPGHALGPRRYVRWDAAGATFYDGIPVSKSGAFFAGDAEALERHWENVPGELEGHFVCVRLRSDPPSVEFATDPLGMRPLYTTRVGQGLLFGNSATLLARIRGSFSLDPLGVSSFLTIGWASGERTLLREIRAVPGGRRWSWCEGEVKRHTYFGAEQLARIEKRALTPDRIRPVLDETLELTRSLTERLGTVVCGLTGGRDSRLLASMLASGRVPVRFVTYAPGDSREAHVATQVARRLELSHEVDPALGGDVIEAWDRIVPEFIIQNDGMVSLWQIQVMVNRSPHVERLEVHLGGHGGEMMRGFYVDPLLMASRAGLRRVQRSLINRLVEDHGGLVKGVASALSRSHLEEFCNRMTESRFPPEDLPDAFYVFERVGRWAATVVRPSLPLVDIFQPLCTRTFAELVFATPLRERYAQLFHSMAIELLTPRLADLPFMKTNRVYHRVARDLLRRLVAADPFALLRGRQHVGTPQAAWIEALRPRLRDVCLGQPDSALWDFIDRSVFESLTDERTPGPRRARAALGIWQVATLFLYSSHCREGSPVG